MASITPTLVTCAAGNTVSLPIQGFTVGQGTVSVDNQLVAAVAGVMTTAPLVIPATIASDGMDDGGQVAMFVVPDGLMSGLATLSDSANVSATVQLRLVTQYVQADEYIGEGANLDPVTAESLQPGELDVVLRRASATVDAFIGGTMRQSMWFERHRFRKSRRLYPYHRPIVSIASLSFVTSNTVRTVFNAADLYVDPDQNYVEMLAYGFGNYALLGAFETVGYSANVLELTILAGYPALNTPNEIREATIMVATSLLNARRKNVMGLGGLKQIEANSLVADQTMAWISPTVKTLLWPFTKRSVR